MSHVRHALQMVRFDARVYALIAAGGIGLALAVVPVGGPWRVAGAAVALGAAWYGAASFLAFHVTPFVRVFFWTAG